MDGIQYIVNEEGEKKAVIIDLEKWGSLWREFSTKIENFSNDNQEKWLNNPPLVSNSKNSEIIDNIS